MAPLGIRDQCIRAITMAMVGIMAASAAGAQPPAAADAGIALFFRPLPSRLEIHQRGHQ